MMIGTKSQNRLKKTVIWLLAIVIVLYGVSGFGITTFRTVETLTFGFLTKNLAFKIHNSLEIPLSYCCSCTFAYRSSSNGRIERIRVNRG
jgi:hypothetical protein